MTEPDPRLLAAAWEARQRAYAPYSQFAVGAALLSQEGQIFTGCNVENLSFGLTLCAERTALCSAITAGARRFAQIVIVAETTVPISPCGACRQVLAEFTPDLPIFSVGRNKALAFWLLSELLPRPAAGILDRPEAK